MPSESRGISVGTNPFLIIYISMHYIYYLANSPHFFPHNPNAVDMDAQAPTLHERLQ